MGKLLLTRRSRSHFHEGGKPTGGKSAFLKIYFGHRLTRIDTDMGKAEDVDRKEVLI
jgi:hypothetical protein